MIEIAAPDAPSRRSARHSTTLLRATLGATTALMAISMAGMMRPEVLQSIAPPMLVATATVLVVWSWMIISGARRSDARADLSAHLESGAVEHSRALQTTLDTLDDGVVMLDAGGRVRVRNRRLAEMLDLTSIAGAKDGDEHGIEDPAVLTSRGGASTLPALAPGRTRLALAGGQSGVIDMHAVRLSDGHLVATFRDVTEARLAEERLVAEAGADAVTGLPNRSRFHAALADACAAHQAGRGFALHMIDLDRFKLVNDTHGHAAGDALLRLVGARIRAELRDADHLFRLGGDEFAVIQSGVRGSEDAAALGERLLKALERPYEVADKHLMVSASIGCVQSLPGDAPPSDVLGAADLALYEAKAHGRHTLRIYEQTMSERVERRRAIESDLRNALAAGQLSLHFQPILRLDDLAVAGFEALMRWNHPIRGFIPPSEFIPIAEESGLIGPLGAWALRSACEEAVKWPHGMRLAVNLSAVQLQSGGFVPALRRALAETRFPATRLEIEITESTILDSNTETRRHLDEMKTMGIRMSMDDFGTGYSSLSYLRAFPFDKIKIDRSFVAEVDRARDCAAIIETIADLARRLAVITTAEGIETPSQLDHLRRLGCTEGQGYLFSRPMPAGEVLAYLARQEQHGRDALSGAV